MNTADERVKKAKAVLRGGDAALDSFITACEQAIVPAPAKLAAGVMAGIQAACKPTGLKETVREHILSRRVWGAACLASAAAIIMFAAFGWNDRIAAFITNAPAQLDKLLSAISMLQGGPT